MSTSDYRSGLHTLQRGQHLQFAHRLIVRDMECHNLLENLGKEKKGSRDKVGELEMEIQLFVILNCFDPGFLVNGGAKIRRGD